MAPTSRLKPLSLKYIKQREREQLHPDTSPARSNLTRTGGMLDAMRFRVTDGRLFVLITEPKELNKATWTHAVRPWINISKGESTALREFAEKLMAAKAKE